MPADVVLDDDEVRVVDGNLSIESSDGDRSLRIDGTAGSLQFANVESPLMYVFEEGTSEPDRPVLAHSPSYPGYGLLYRDQGDTMIFQGDGYPVLTADLGARRVGVGTDAPNHTLDVRGSVAGLQPYRTLSDEQFSRNVESIRDAVEKVQRIRGVTYKLDVDELEDEFDREITGVSRGRRYGFVGQELADDVPEVVSEDDEGRHSVQQSSIVPLLVEALKDQQEQIEEQAAAIEDLRGQVADLETQIEEDTG